MDKAIKTPNRTGILVRALIVLAMCGIVNSAAVFVSPMAKHFGWTTEAIAGVATYMAFMQTPGHILSGWLLGKIGAKKTLILGCILLGLAFLLSGMVPSGSPWMLYITFSVLQGLGVGFTYTGSTYCATGWYPDKRGLASGLCMAFNGGSATFLAPLIVKLISSIGIIVTLYIVGGAIIVIGICAAIGLKTAPVGYAPAGWKAKADDPKLAATLLIKPLQLLFEVVFVMANRVVGDPGLAIIALSLAMNFLVLPLYRRADAMQEEARRTLTPENS